MSKVISAALWVIYAIVTILFFIAVVLSAIILYPFDKKRKFTHAISIWWAKTFIALNPFFKYSITGLENIDQNRTYVIIANHQSMVDIVVLYQLHMQYKWVIKKRFFKVPVMGWALSIAKYIKLRPGKLENIKKVYQDASDWLRKDMSVLFFPEGTRSLTGEMQPFQSGAFKLAIKEKKPILPIVVHGTSESLPKGGWILTNRVSAKLKVLPAIDTVNFQRKDFNRLRDIVQEEMKREMISLQINNSN